MKLLFRLILATALLALCSLSHAQLTLTGAGRGGSGVAPGYLYFGTISGATNISVYPTLDGITYSAAVNSTCFSSTAKTVTPTVYFRASDTTMWMVTNITNSTSAQQLHLQLWQVNLTGLTCRFVTNIDFSGVISGANAAVWSGQWYDDGSGTPCIFAGASSTANLDVGFTVYRVCPTDLSGYTTWGTPVAISGTSLVNNMIDPFVWYEGGVCYLFYKNETTKYVEVLTNSGDSTCASNFVETNTGDWAGWGSHLEAPYVVKIGSTYRILLDNEGAGIYYSDSTAITGTYSAKTAITVAGGLTLQHASLYPITPGYSNGTTASIAVARTSGMDPSHQNAYTNFINSAVSDGSWAIADDIHILGTDTSGNALINLSNNLFSATAHGTITFTANQGYAGNASTGYLDTNDVPWFAKGTTNTSPGNYTPQYQKNAASLFVYIRTARASGANYSEMGNNGGGSGIASDFFPWYSDNNAYAELNANGGGHTHPTSDVSGFWLVTRTASNLITVYHNGTSVFTDSTSSGANNPIWSFLIAASANAGTGAAANFSSDQIALAGFGGSFDATHAANFSTDVATLATALGW